MNQTEALEKVDFSALAQFMSPEDLAAINERFSGGITGGTYLPELKYRGNKWRIKIDDEEKILPSMSDTPDCVIVHLVDARPNVSKTYYAGGYEQGSNAKPDCSSVDGFVPDSHIETPQSDNCQTCPHNAWGSRISDSGGKGKACSDYKQIVIAFRGRADKAFALRVPPASLKAYKAYISQLSFNKVPASLALTQIQLDPETTYPNFLFTCVGVVSSKAEFDALQELAKSTDVQQVVQIQPRAETKQIEAKTAEQPVVVPPVVPEPVQEVAKPDLKAILEGGAKKTRKKKTVEQVIEESTAESEPQAEPGVVSSLDELLSRI